MAPEYHPCALCELRFTNRNELADHVAVDHLLRVRDDIPPPPHPRGLITLPVDHSRPPTIALPVAAALARQAGLAVEAIAAPMPGLTGPARYLAARHAEVIAAGALAAPSHEVPQPAADGIVDHLAEAPTSLVCLATRAHAGLVEHTLGSVSAEVVRRSPVPVVLVGPHVRDPGSRVERLVVGFDGSPLSAHALDVAGRLADALGVGLDVVEVVTARGEASARSEATGRADAVEALPSPPHSSQVVHGDDPVRALVDAAGDTGGTLLVVGTHGHRGVDRIALGSVALGVTRQATVPVVVVPPDAVLHLSSAPGEAFRPTAPAT